MVRILIDSTADLPEKLKKKTDVIPLTVTFGTEEYVYEQDNFDDQDNY